MKFKVKDRVICTNPKDDLSGHHLEWVGVTGTVVAVSETLEVYKVWFDTIPAYYTALPDDSWYCDEYELSLIDDYPDDVVEVSDLI